jgi:Mat/Ecp fimbriae major subunit
MLNKIKFALAGTIAAAAMVSGAANAATQNATAEAEIITPVALSSVTLLDFGLIASSADEGTVALGGSDTRTCSSEVVCVGTASRGKFNVSAAAAGQVIALGFTDDTISLTGPAGSTPMEVSLSLSTSQITFDAAALEDVFVGGTLTVGGGQAAGEYSGTYQVTADYN